MSTTTATTTKATITFSQTVKSFLSDNDIASVSKVRVNMNGYPYITFLDSDSNAENIYFSKSLAEDLNLRAGDSPACLKGKNILTLEYDNGETRFKIAKQGSDDYVSVDDLF